MLNYYDLLLIEENASFSEIKSSYRKLVKIHHPDKGGDVNNYLDITRAYEVLKDIDKRRKYDLSLEENRKKESKLQSIVNKTKVGFTEFTNNKVIYKKTQPIYKKTQPVYKNTIFK